MSSSKETGCELHVDLSKLSLEKLCLITIPSRADFHFSTREDWNGHGIVGGIHEGGVRTSHLNYYYYFPFLALPPVVPLSPDSRPFWCYSRPLVN